MCIRDSICGVLILTVQHEQLREAALHSELAAMDEVLHRQYEQYKRSKMCIRDRFQNVQKVLFVTKSDKVPHRRYDLVLFDKIVFFDHILCPLDVYKRQHSISPLSTICAYSKGLL